MGNRVGGIKIAANKAGLSFDEYLTRRDSGLKLCTRCREWLPISAFALDKSRIDGIVYVCKECRHYSRNGGPTRQKRREMRVDGFEWCRNCRTWYPMDEINGGLCREHKNAYMRRLYATDPNFRLNRLQHAKAHRRSIRQIPADVQNDLVEYFDGKCVYCGGDGNTWDHIVPVSKGGDSTPGNIVLACLSCNSSKHNYDLEEWITRTGKDPSYLLFDRMILVHCGYYSHVEVASWV